MDIKEIFEKETKRIIFLKEINNSFANEKEKAKEWFYEDWDNYIINKADNMKEVAEEDGYIISFQNIEILSARETNINQPFSISVWEAAKWQYDETGNKSECNEIHYAYAYEK